MGSEVPNLNALVPNLVQFDDDGYGLVALGLYKAVLAV